MRLDERERISFCLWILLLFRSPLLPPPFFPLSPSFRKGGREEGGGREGEKGREREKRGEKEGKGERREREGEKEGREEDRERKERREGREGGEGEEEKEEREQGLGTQVLSRCLMNMLFSRDTSTPWEARCSSSKSVS